MPTAVSAPGVCAVTMPEGDEALVVIGGTVDRETVSTVQVLRRGSWSQLSPLPTRREGFSLCALSGRVVVVGGLVPGRGARKTVEILDISQDSWETLPEMREARKDPRVVAHDGTLTVVGGSFNPPEASAYSCREMRSSCEQLQVGADEWTEMAPLPACLAARETARPIGVIRGCIATLQPQAHPDPGSLKPDECFASISEIMPPQEFVCHVYDLADDVWRTKCLGEGSLPRFDWEKKATATSRYGWTTQEVWTK